MLNDTNLEANLSRRATQGTPIDIGMVVTIRSRIVDQNGTLIHDSLSAGEPMTFVYGSDRILPGLHRVLHGRRQGESFQARIKPEHAYANHRRHIKIPRSVADAQGPLHVGQMIDVETHGLTQEAEVIELGEDRVLLKTTGKGHPLEHATLCYEPLEIVSVRPASADELRRAGLVFPFDLFAQPQLPDPVGSMLAELVHLSLFPPYPWGQWLYARLFEERWSQLPGDVAEMGVARGGMSLFLGRLAKTAGKRVFSYDSYGGLPAPDDRVDNPYFKQGDYVPRNGDLLTRFEAEIERHDLVGTVVPVKGYFSDTLPKSSDRTYSFVHIDADLYESVMTSLQHSWSRLAEGGILVIDDFFHPCMGPRKAAADFFAGLGEDVVYHVSFPYAAFFIKGEKPRKRTRSVDGLVYSLEWLRSDLELVKAVRASVTRMAGCNDRPTENARAFLALLEAEEHRSSDIFAYFRLLEDFWDRMAFADAGQIQNRAPIRI